MSSPPDAPKPDRRPEPIPAAWPVRSSPAAHAWAMISAGLAPILLTGAYLIAGLLQPASYSPVRTTISAMAGQAGTDRWVMTGGIFLVAGCYLVTAAGLTGVRASARALLAVAGMAGIGIAASPEPARGAAPRHLAWTVLGAVTIAVWPAFAARRASPRPLILSVYGSAAVTAVFVGLLGWLLAETRDGSVLGLAERLTSSIQTCWPFIIAVALRRTRRPRPGLAIGGSGRVKDGPPRGPEPAAAGSSARGAPTGCCQGRRCRRGAAGRGPGRAHSRCRRRGRWCRSAGRARGIATTAVIISKGTSSAGRRVVRGLSIAGLAAGSWPGHGTGRDEVQGRAAPAVPAGAMLRG